MLTSKVLDSRETVIAELKKDPEFKNIYNYLADPENFNHPDIVPIRNRAENYELIDGLLFYTKATNENHEYRPVIPASMRLNVLEELHDCAISAHLGIRKTVQRVREAVFFPELQKFTRAYVQSCPTCQLNNYVNFRPAGFLNSIKSEFPNQIIGIDLLGPYPRSKVNKSRYLLVIVDHFSKWLELIPLKRASAKIVVDSILNKYILKYGAPLKVISDNGPQFVSKMFEEMCAKLGIRHLKMVPYRPQSNIAERVNRNVVKIIRSYVKNYHSTWDSHINEFAFALRTAKHDTTQKTPAELFLGRKILTPLDKLFFVQERAEEFKMSDIQKLIREATENIEMAQRKQKLYYDLKRREVKYNVGDEVLKIKHNLSNAPEEKVGKFFPRFEGPFTIEQITGAVVILKRNDGQTLKANVDQIKPFYNRSKMAVFKDSFQDPRQSTSQEDIRQQKQQEPATTASKCQKKKAPPQQRNKNQKGGFKRKSHDAGEQIYERNYERTKRRKQNGQGKPNVSKRTVESSDRCLRSKKRRLQPENQLPEYSRNQDKQRARAQERRAQSTKRPAEQPPLQRKLPRIQRRNFKRKRDEQAPKEQRKTRKLNQATTYSSFKDWAKKRMDDHNKIIRPKCGLLRSVSLPNWELFDEKPGSCQIVSHSIDTGNEPPVQSKPYRYDRVKEDILEQHITKMLEDKISTSPYASPVVLCREKNGLPAADPNAWRFAIDYRKFNSITKYPTYPLPIIDEIIRKTRSTKSMTTLDLTSGYFQIAVKPEDVAKTAFITKSGEYAFLRMPFGLSGAPATFQKVMDIVLRPVLGKSTVIYLYDIIVTSETLEEHIKHLEEVFTLLYKAGLKVNPKKCKFASKELRLLLQAPETAQRILISLSPSKDPPATKRKAANSEEGTAKRRQLQQDPSSTRTRSTKQIKVPFQQRPAPVGQLKRHLQDKQRKRQTTKPKPQEVTTRICQPKASMKRKQLDDKRSTPFQEPRRTKRVFKDSETRKEDRFNWCKEHQNWTEHQWSHVLFTDESRFSLTGDSKRVYIWRESGTQNDPSNIVERDRFGSGGVMVWGGITIDGRTPLHVFSSGSVTGQIYRDEVLDPYARLFRGAYGPDLLFMGDNARPHRANLVDEFLESEDIKRIPWPPNSRDLNPIANLWDYLGRAIAPPRYVNALKKALLEEWRLIPQTVVNNVISSLKTRCDMCVQVREDHIPY
ncbi:Retrovirus-related Pol polyprotein from transposon 297, partial [Stegodyphus mimosarum]